MKSVILLTLLFISCVVATTQSSDNEQFVYWSSSSSDVEDSENENSDFVADQLFVEEFSKGIALYDANADVMDQDKENDESLDDASSGDDDELHDEDKFFRRIVSAFRRVVSGIGRIIRSGFRAIGDLGKRIVHGVTRVIQNGLAAVQNFVAKVGRSIGSFLAKYAPFVLKIMNNPIFKIVTMAMNFIPGLGLALGNVSNMLTSLSGGLSGFAGIGSGFISKGATFLSKLATNANSFIGKLASGLQTGLQTLSGSKLGGIFNKFGNFVTKIQSVGDDLLTGNVFSLFENHISKLPLARKIMQGPIGTIIKKGKDLFGKFGDSPIGKKLRPEFEKLKHQLMEGIQSKLIPKEYLQRLAEMTESSTRLPPGERINLDQLLKQCENPAELRQKLEEALGRPMTSIELSQFKPIREQFELQMEKKSKMFGFRYKWHQLPGYGPVKLHAIRSQGPNGPFVANMVAFKALRLQAATVIWKYFNDGVMKAINKRAMFKLVSTLTNAARRYVKVGQAIYTSRGWGDFKTTIEMTPLLEKVLDPNNTKPQEALLELIAKGTDHYAVFANIFDSPPQEATLVAWCNAWWVGAKPEEFTKLMVVGMPELEKAIAESKEGLEDEEDVMGPDIGI